MGCQGPIPCKSRYRFPVHSCTDPVPHHRCPPRSLSVHSHRPHSLESLGNPGSTDGSSVHQRQAYTGSGQWAPRSDDWLTLHYCNCRPERKSLNKYKRQLLHFHAHTLGLQENTKCGEIIQMNGPSQCCHMDSLPHMPAGGSNCIAGHLCIFVAQAHGAKTVTRNSICLIRPNSSATFF